MSEKTPEKTYSPEEIAAKLASMPHWKLEDGWIKRTYRTHSWKGTLMVINTVGHLAEAAWHHPDITASYAWVEVRLSTHSAKGVTDKDFELARKIEDVVGCNPRRKAARSKARRKRTRASPILSMTKPRLKFTLALRSARSRDCDK